VVVRYSYKTGQYIKNRQLFLFVSYSYSKPMPPDIKIKGTPNLQTFENDRDFMIDIKKFCPKKISA